jgi:hypothetical protein
MSLKPSLMQAVPDMTVQVAHAAFPKGSPYLTLRDELGPIFVDEDFLDLYPEDGQPALTPGGWRWSRFSSFGSICPTAKPQRPCERASTGNISWVSR